MLFCLTVVGDSNAGSSIGVHHPTRLVSPLTQGHTLKKRKRLIKNSSMFLFKPHKRRHLRFCWLWGYNQYQNNKDKILWRLFLCPITTKIFPEHFNTLCNVFTSAIYITMGFEHVTLQQQFDVRAIELTISKFYIIFYGFQMMIRNTVKPFFFLKTENLLGII